MMPIMSNDDAHAGRYGDALEMLARVCLSQHPDADTNDVAEAIGLAIGRSLPSNVNAVAMMVDIIDGGLWPSSQRDADLFIGRYLREYRMLARRATRRHLRGIDPIPREAIDAHFRPRRDDDREGHEEEKHLHDVMTTRSVCIAMLDDACDERSPIFESVRIVIGSGDRDRMTDYVTAWLRYMMKSGHPDSIIARRLKKTMNSPRIAVLSTATTR